MRTIAVALVEWAFLRYGLGFAVAWMVRSGDREPSWVLTYNVIMMLLYLAYVLLGPSPARNPLVWGRVRWTGLLAALSLVAVHLAGRWDHLPRALPMIAEAARPSRYPLSTAFCFVAPVKEELLYRGILLRRLDGGISTWLAVVLSGLVFGLAHPSPVEAVLYGLWLGALYTPYLGANLVLPILMHVLANLTSTSLPPIQDGF